jgi:NADH-quinone oxidoreductase subunit M
MQHYLLSLLLFIPLVAAFVSLFIPKTFSHSFRVVALSASSLQLIILTSILTGYSNSSGLQFIEHQPWITLDLGSWGILKAEYFVALDGLNLPLVALSVFIMLIATISSIM